MTNQKGSGWRTNDPEVVRTHLQVIKGKVMGIIGMMRSLARAIRAKESDWKPGDKI